MRKINAQTVTLSDEQRKQLMEQIHDFFDAEFGDDIGIIKQSQILDLFLEQHLIWKGISELCLQLLLWDILFLMP